MNMLERINEKIVDKAGVLGRFMNNAALWEKFALKFIDDQTFIALDKAMTDQNMEEAFKEAHTLKGVVGNLGFTELYQSVSSLVELLRTQAQWQEMESSWGDVQAAYEKVLFELKKSRE